MMTMRAIMMITVRVTVMNNQSNCDDNIAKDCDDNECDDDSEGD